MSQLSAVFLWRGHREALNFPASFCDPSYLLVWACTPSLGELASTGYSFIGILASVWQSGQIHALGITLVCFEAVLVKKRFCSKLLPALGNTESSNAWDDSGHWAALISPLFRSIQTEGKVPWKVRNILLCSVSLGTWSLARLFLLQVSLTLYQETAWFLMLYFFVPVAFSSTLVPSHEFFGQVVFILVAISHRTLILSRKQIYLWWEMIQVCVCYNRDTQSCSFCVDPVP